DQQRLLARQRLKITPDRLDEQIPHPDLNCGMDMQLGLLDAKHATPAAQCGDDDRNHLRDTDPDIARSNENALFKVPQSNLATRGKAAIQLLQLAYVILSQPAFEHLVDDPRHGD